MNSWLTAKDLLPIRGSSFLHKYAGMAYLLVKRGHKSPQWRIPTSARLPLDVGTLKVAELHTFLLKS